MKLLLVLLAASTAAAQPRVLESKPCPSVSGSYDEYVARFQKETQALIDRATETKHREELKSWKPMDQAQFDATFKDSQLKCERFVYLSDGLKVIGYTLRTVGALGKLPVLLFLRGGNRELGKVDERLIARMLQPFARAGYLVVAPQYRQADGGEGKDEYGGADVNDVLAAAEIVRARPDADGNNVFLYGVSRGGMMAYIALHRGLRVNAAVVHAGLSDMAGELKERPTFERMWREMIPRWSEARDEVMRARSAVMWADELEQPILILQGTADWRVTPSDALRVAEKLQAKKRDYGLVMYAGDDHPLTKNFADAVQRSLDWYAAHRR
jgi:dipeptidyl aminopeptidase/acylaminoacyl peptidase